MYTQTTIFQCDKERFRQIHNSRLIRPIEKINKSYIRLKVEVVGLVVIETAEDVESVDGLEWLVTSAALAGADVLVGLKVGDVELREFLWLSAMCTKHLPR